MRAYPRVRKTIKWAGAGLILLLLAMWLASLRWAVVWAFSHRGGVTLSAGRFELVYDDGTAVIGSFGVPPLYIAFRSAAPLWQMHFDHCRSPANPEGLFAADVIYIDLPLWLPAVLTLAVTIPAWRLDAFARRQSGLCSKCGYSLVGLPAGSTCPECGRSGTGSTS